MEIQAFGYLGVGSDKAEDWSAFAPAWLGMQEVDRGGGARAFRMDDASGVCSSIAPSRGQVFGWEVANSSALDALAACLEGGVVVARAGRVGRPALCGRACLRRSRRQPAGGVQRRMIADTPFKPARHRRLPHWRAGMGHAAGGAGHRGGARLLLRLLGFKVSDYMPRRSCLFACQRTPPQHRDRRRAGGKDAPSLVGFLARRCRRGYDMVRAEPERIAAKLGRHPTT